MQVFFKICFFARWQDKPKMSSFDKSACWWNKTNSQAITNSLGIKKQRLQGSTVEPNAYCFHISNEICVHLSIIGFAIKQDPDIQHVFLRFPDSGFSWSETKASTKHTSTCFNGDVQPAHVAACIFAYTCHSSDSPVYVPKPYVAYLLTEI